MIAQFLYVIKDNVSGQHSPIFLETNDDSAKRQFGVFLSGVQFPPSNYDLWHLGTFSSESMRIVAGDAIHLGNGDTYQSWLDKGVQNV